MKFKFDEPKALNQVAEFHQTFRLPILKEPTIPSGDRCQLRINLLAEELKELEQAIQDNDLVEIADALCDLQYVLSGAVLEFGLADKFNHLFEEVQRSNMSKVCDSLEDAEATLEHYRKKDGTEGQIEPAEDGFLVYRTADKKVLKSVRYSPADLKTILDR
ncbi:MAG: nucleoside triphosphate pyrophosphohydrolase family protein [Saprospiraceae bacterium]|nr:nucleoside triphosphate pyrophosphohydrolase family protein [Saprospiraceae bacterium]